MNTLLKDRRLILIVLANFVSSIGSGVTSIGASWLLVNRENGEYILGYTMLGITILLFVLNPYIGIVIDRFSRKKVYLFNQVLGLTIVGSVTLWGMIADQYHAWQLITFMFSFSLYFSLHYPTLLAIVQEMFSRSSYRSLNGILEIESQSASAVAGGIAGILLGIIDYDYIFLFDTFTFVFSFVFISFIPYQKRYEIQNKRVTIISDIYEGLQFLKGKLLLVVLLLGTLMPFICVTVYNYVKPVYIASTIEENVSAFGLSEMFYAIGAILAGLIIPMLGKRIGYFGTITIMMTVFTVFLVTMAEIPLLIVFLSVTLLAGLGNAGTRIMRRTIMMELVPNDIIGRVNSFFKGIELMIRIGLLVIFVQFMSGTGAITALMVMSALMIVALIGVLVNKNIITQAEKGSLQRTG
ncbi:MFS transporter [Tuberibacillus sp. Marseille-P3662]|uniref:MFS transporter n=1 Tax=Tuberibacillus sp. Marseille-P3662 TaxID=1965358 RepID=UPI000A1CD892|nr:MFS transporter [Tuberibacillus sp. Marseille-P3662]